MQNEEQKYQVRYVQEHAVLSAESYIGNWIPFTFETDESLNYLRNINLLPVTNFFSSFYITSQLASLPNLSDHDIDKNLDPR